MTVKHFYRQHASEKHGLDVRKQCVFCFGRHDWDHGQKNRPDHINHVVSCLKRFARDAKDYWAYLDQDDEDIGVEEESHVCECRHFQSIPRDMQGRPRMEEGFYESVLEKPDLWEEGLSFNDASGLGNDVWGILRRYLRGEWVWFHIMVKHDVFETFRREMERIRDQCVLLPFWCLCDGLETERETCILNIPVGTELQVNGGQPEYLTNTFVRIKEGFLYIPLDHSDESHCLVSRYVPREAMLDLIVSGLALCTCTRIMPRSSFGRMKWYGRWGNDPIPIGPW
ncbi:uncharacterized protein TNCV_3462521 [Trichonephila clavipes]|nr:uncharacterized protein TNCV_3462521 [Trichonephila clavipes]